LAEFGRPRELPECGGWVLKRAIPGCALEDAMGCYPLFVCQDWSRLKSDLEALAAEVVCITLVTDPFGNYTMEQLHECFADRVLPFKEHYVLDLHRPAEQVVRKRLLRYARAALRELSVEVCCDPADYRDDWIAMHQYLVKRHQIRGIHAFSAWSLAAQTQVPGFVMFRAICQGATVGMLSWYVHGEVGYAHLIGISPAGYERRAGCALYWSSIQHFAGKLRWLNWTGVPGATHDSHHGLAVFKRGWATGTRWVYLCGRIFDREAYSRIAKKRGLSHSTYFPAYRAGEFSCSEAPPVDS
jgi:hypothetical protein